jgi:hypothetical protein
VSLLSLLLSPIFFASLGYEHYDVHLPVSGVPMCLADQGTDLLSVAGVSRRLALPDVSR